jgi:L-asparaginase II
VIVLQRGVPLAQVERSGVVETVHSGHMIVLGPAGDVVIELGEPRQPMFPRSSNKPLQAVGMLRCRLEVPAEHLALAAASHSGEERHVERVRDMLAAGGLDEDDLAYPAS